MDQSAGAGWRTLGTFDFAAGGGQHVSVHDDTAAPVAKGQRIVVDAVRLLPATSKPKPPPAPAPKKQGPPKTKSAPSADGGVPWASPDGEVPTPYEPGAWPGHGQVMGGCAVAGEAAGWPALLVLVLALLRRRSIRTS